MMNLFLRMARRILSGRLAHVPFCAVLWLGSGAVFAQEAGTPDRERGPLVEVTLRDGAPFICSLLSFKDGVLQLVLVGGTERSERAEIVRSVRFLSPSSSSSSSSSPSPPPALSGGAGGSRAESFVETAESLRRLRQLAQKDREGSLTQPELAEYNRLRQNMPYLLPFDLRRRGAAAEEMARQENRKGRLDAYIALLQQRLWNAAFHDTARETLVLLVHAYHEKNVPAEEIAVKIKQDVQGMVHAGIKEKLALQVSEEVTKAKGTREYKKSY